MKYIILIFLFLSFNDCYSQNFIRVLGRNNYTRIADFNRIRINLNQIENSVIDKNTIIQNIKQFDNLINIDSSDENLLSIDFNNQKVFDFIDSLNKKKFIKTTQSYIFQNSNFEYQDDLAINAITDANEKAKLIAKIIGKEIDKILNIDDKVEQYLFYPEYNLKTECEKKILTWLIEYLSDAEDDNRTEFDSYKRNGEYAIWVTYKLKD